LRAPALCFVHLSIQRNTASTVKLKTTRPKIGNRVVVIVFSITITIIVSNRNFKFLKCKIIVIQGVYDKVAHFEFE